MCIFIYTLPQQCGHKFFQNVSACPIARGIAPTTDNRLDATLSTPKFLFDTSRSCIHTPEAYSREFACRKRKAIRPVPRLCDRCVKDTREEKQRGTEKERQSGRMNDFVMVLPSGDGVLEGMVASSGSAAALMGAGALAAASTSSTLHDTSGMSVWETDLCQLNQP